MDCRNLLKYLSVVICLFLISGCAATRPPLKTVEKMDLKRFMGPWYVIACIPVFIEAKAYNEVETYTLLSDGSIDTVLAFNEGSFEGPIKRHNPRGFIVDKVNNSTWGMQFIWPFKAEYLITHMNSDYSQTIVGRNKRDYFWLMARTPSIPEEDYKRLMGELDSQGYDMTKVRRVPQRLSNKE